MEVRESYRREFLESLRQSPAWELFCTSMLKEMKFLQDDVKFRMNGVAQYQPLIPQYLKGEVSVLESEKPTMVTMDVTEVRLKFSGCLISTDGTSWKNDEVVTSQFWIKSTKFQYVKDVIITCLDFYPNHLSCNDMKMLLSVDGLNRDDVTDSSFDVVFSATSVYLMHYILTRAEIPYDMEYFFLDKSEVETTGVKTETVRNGVTLIRAEGNQFYYKSNLTLVAGKDRIVTDSGIYNITSVNANTLTCGATEAAGTFNVFRNEYLVPLYPSAQLVSALELTFDSSDADIAKRFIPRVTPVRCSQGFRGNIDLRIRTIMKLFASCAIPKIVTKTNLKIVDELSLMRNFRLFIYSNRLVDKDAEILDLGYSDNTLQEIELV